MSTEKDVFDALVANVFSDEELTVMREAGAAAYYMEPVTPNRKELLELLDSAMDSLLHMRIGQEWGSLRERVLTEFSNRLVPVLGLRYGEETLIRGACSFMVHEGDGLGTLDGNPVVIGDFLGMDIDSWYDMPFSEAALEASECYKRDIGLHVVLGCSRLEFADGSTEILGNVTVPLNHGEPTLYRVQRQQL